MFGKYFYNGSWQARSFIKKLGRSLFDCIPQGEKLGHSGAVTHALHFSEVIECRIADLTPHHLPTAEHRKPEGQTLRVVTQDLMTCQRHV